MSKIPVMEIFGSTIQGEGAMAGAKTMFLRSAGCDFSCAWCDSHWTWDGSEKATMMTAQEVYDKLFEIGGQNFDWVTISGGNPALVKEPVQELITMLHEKGIFVALETQGSKWQDWFFDIDCLTISPKPPSSGMTMDFETLDAIENKLWSAGVNFNFKVVVFDDADYNFAKYVHLRYPLREFYLSVGNSDVKEDGDISKRILEKLGWLWDKVIEDPDMNDVRTFPQLHTLVWGNKKGV